jgi:hypothetical protein
MYNTKVKALLAGVKKSKIKMSEVNIGLSDGNAKLVETASTKFLIWSITSVKTCPLATPMCIKACYATKAERIYPSVATRRDSNLKASKEDSFVMDMIELIDYELSLTTKNINFRIHESGDFYTADYLFKWCEITDYFKDNKRITFMAYTKSLPFVKRAYEFYGTGNVNIKFMASVWDDTSKAMLKLGSELGLNVFTALTVDQFQTKDYSKYFKCPSTASLDKYGCGECSEKHGSCYTGKVNIAIEIH